MWSGHDIKKARRPLVILCAGEGRRLADLGKEIPKAMVKLSGRPIISYVVDYWKDFASEFMFVVGYKKEQIISFVETRGLGPKVRFAEQLMPRGIAHAIGYIENYIKDDFIVVLGDCLCRGDFTFPGNFSQGVGVWTTNNDNYIKQSYSVEVEKDLIRKVVEKPKEIKNNLCGMGYYFFNRKVFDYVRKTPPSALRSEVEITDVIQAMIDGGEAIAPIYFKGEYLNVTSMQDIAMAERMFQDK